MESMKKEVLQEMEAVKHFIELAIEAQKIGYTKAAQFFIAEAQEDCHHAFLYARELDKYHTPTNSEKNIVEITKIYHNMEFGAIDRIAEMFKEAKELKLRSVQPFLVDMMGRHSEDCYKAKKLLQKVEVLHPTDALTDIEELFEEGIDE